MKKISLEEIEEIEEKRICQGKKEFTKFVANPLCKFPITDVIREFSTYNKENKWNEALKSYNFIMGYLWGLESVDKIDSSQIDRISSYLLSLL